MELLQNATRQDVKRLLDSFPVSALKDGWPNVKGTKEEICFAAAEEHNLDKIVEFMKKNIARCKRHIYVFSAASKEVSPLSAVPDVEILDVDGGGRTVALTKAVFSIFLKDPLEENTVEFLWPMRVETIAEYLVVSFVILERNPCVYFEDRDCYQSARSIDERGIAKNLESLGFQRADLHKGVKVLWEENFIDSFRTRYKKPMSTASEHMDEELGIKQHNPELYEQLQSATLFATLFEVVPGTDCCVEIFQVDPSVGYIAFSRYTEGTGDSQRDQQNEPGLDCADFRLGLRRCLDSSGHLLRFLETGISTHGYQRIARWTFRVVTQDNYRLPLPRCSR